MSDEAAQIWVLTDESPHGSDAEMGYSLVGLFSSKQEALDYLCDEVLGPELFAEVVWEPAPDNPTHSEGWGIGASSRRYILTTAVVQSYTRRRPGRAESEHGV